MSEPSDTISKQDGDPPLTGDDPQVDADNADVLQAKAIRKLSESKPEVLHEMMATMVASGPMTHPLHQKMNSSHISQVLEISAKHDAREFELAKGEQKIKSSDRWVNLVIFVFLVIVVLVIVVLFKNDPSTLNTVITAIVSLGGGFGAGWGLAKHKSN